jgi:hypothetical protein
VSSSGGVSTRKFTWIAFEKPKKKCKSVVSKGREMKVKWEEEGG